MVENSVDEDRVYVSCVLLLVLSKFSFSEIYLYLSFSHILALGRLYVVDLVISCFMIFHVIEFEHLIDYNIYCLSLIAQTPSIIICW